MMRLSLPKNIYLGFLIAALSGSCQTKSVSTAIEDSSRKQFETNVEELKLLAEQVYAFGYPLVLMDITRDMMTYSASATDSSAPLNQFVHKKTLPDASFIGVVNPNADVLYSSAWLDLSKEPIVLSLPDTGHRYYLMQMMSAWTEVFANPGSRTTGNGRQNFIVTGPRWSGQIPVGVRQIKSPTNDVWLIGRTETNGPKDYPAVHALQRQYKLVPLSSWGTDYQPPTHTPLKEGVNLNQSAVDQVDAMSGLEFFGRMAESMKRNPPLNQDALMVEKMQRLSIIPGQSFDPMALSPGVRSAMDEGARSALERIINSARHPHAEKVNGWVYNFNLGRYGINYNYRALIAMTALGASLPQDALYIRCLYDSRSVRLNGKNNYIIHFNKNQIPPVEGLWSISMYNRKNTFVENPLDRYTLGDRNRMIFNRDGSLDIYVQYQPPAKRLLSNWLPTPRGDFNLVARLYWPEAEVLSRQWRMPPVLRIQKMEKPKQLSLQTSIDSNER